MTGDGVATMAAATIWCTTKYHLLRGDWSAVMLTKAFNPVIMTWAAVTALY